MALDRRLETRRFPYLPLQIRIHDRSPDVEALVDTGFDGHIILPPNEVQGLEPDDRVPWILADDSEVLVPAYVASARITGFDGFPVLVSILGHEPIVGRGVTDRFTLILDHGQRLIVEP